MKVWRADVKISAISTKTCAISNTDMTAETKSVITQTQCDSVEEDRPVDSKMRGDAIKVGSDYKYKIAQGVQEADDTATDKIDDHKFTYEYLAGVQLSELSGRKVKKPWKYPVENSDPETRILDLTVINLPMSLYLIGAACSDGLVR